jgi:hypothetical protein
MPKERFTYENDNNILKKDSPIISTKDHAKTGLVFFPAFDWAISPTHPEREERLLYTRDQIFEEGILDNPRIK